MLYHKQCPHAFPAVSALALCIGALSAPAHAQSGPPVNDEPTTPSVSDAEDDFHDGNTDPYRTIIVTAPGLTQLDVLTGTSVVEGRELQRNMDGQIGEILAKQPGVSATSFAPGASRPVLRGFDGERVRVLVNGLGTLDVSNTSADHAVSVEPLTVESIEILRGPAVLLYGGQAIGGAVNIIDKRIPLRPLDEPFHLDGLFEADTARDLLSGAVSLDLPVGDKIVLHADGAYRNTDDIEIPGFSVAPVLRDDLLADAAEEAAEGEFEESDELLEAANQQGILPNSFTETYSANIGASVFVGDGSLGFSAGYYDTVYGIPGRPGAGHHHGEEGGEEDGGEEEGEARVSIDLEQFRADLRGDVPLGDGFFSRLQTRIGYSDYTHTEFEGEEAGTVFDVEGIEARAELVQARRGILGGSIGVQYYHRDFAAVGEEAFVAPNLTDQFAVFALQELDFDTFQLEGAARYERVDIRSQPLNTDRDFDLFSGALSAIYQPMGDDGLRIGITGSRSARAPGGEELFANGPHIATQSFEVGDIDLNEETAFGVEGFVRGAVGPATIAVSVFKNWFDDYIYLQGTGEEEDDLPVFQFLQDDAEYSGVEGEVQVPLIAGDAFGLLADLRAQYVEAELDDGTNLPRIPPFSALGALEAEAGAFDGRVEVQYFAEQSDIAPFETTTDDFTFVNASISWAPVRGNENIRLLLRADNIFDATGRRHTSFTKDFAPLTGRNFRVSLRTSF
ncbi:MAG: TonB-dependent receptor [Pontixanthobacter sp.]